MDLKEKELREDMGSLSDKMQGIVDNAEEEDRDLTEEEAKEFDQLEAKYDKKEKQLRRHITLREQKEFTETSPEKELIEKTEVKVKKDELETEGALAKHTLSLYNGMIRGKETEVNAAIGKLAKGGHYGKDIAEATQRAAGDYYSTVIDADGATLLPTVVQSEIDTIANEYGVIRQVARKFTHIRGTLKRGAATGTLPASAIAEGGAISASMRQFQAIELNPQKWAVIVPWTFEANLELATQILSDVNREIGESFAKAEDDAGLNGDGTATYNSITGILNNANVGELTLAGGSTSFADITPDNLVLARNEVPSSLRKSGVYVFHPDLEAIFLTKQDGQGAYIFDYQVVNGVPTLKGRPVYYTESLPGLDADAVSTSFGVYGDFRYWIMALGAGMSAEELDQGIITDADTGADINLSTQDLRALKFRNFFDMDTNFGSAFMKFTTPAA